MRMLPGSPTAGPGKRLAQAVTARLSAGILPLAPTGWRLAALGMLGMALLTVVLVLALGDTQSFPRVRDKQIPTPLLGIGADSEADLERGVISDEIRAGLSDRGAGLSDLAVVSTVEEGLEWVIIAPRREFVAVARGEALNIGSGLINAGGYQYQEDLAQGNIPEGLGQEFQLKGMGLSDSAKVSTLEAGGAWSITDPRKKYRILRRSTLNVGDVTLVVDPGTLTALDDGLVSEDLKSEFRRKEVGLSNTATVSILEPGAAWLVDDPILIDTHTVTSGDGLLEIEEIEDKDIFLNEDIAWAVDTATDYMTTEGQVVFDAIGGVIKKLLTWIEHALLWVPYQALICAVALLAWRMAGFGVCVFSVIGLLLIGFVGFWPSAMETLSLMMTAVAVSSLIAIPVGIVAARSNAVDAALRPLLDGMQTMPSFVYLVPAIFFFGLGNVPAVIATIIYAVPPAIRLTNLGIRQVSPDTLEAARAFGATPTQLLFKVQMPLALPTIMAGINQTTMMALAMVVVASLVGAGGLGADVLKAIGRLQIGNSVLAGMSIVFLAIIIDRITQGFAAAQARATRE